MSRGRIACSAKSSSRLPLDQYWFAGDVRSEFTVSSSCAVNFNSDRHTAITLFNVVRQNILIHNFLYFRSFPFDTQRFPFYEIHCIAGFWDGLYHAHIDAAIDGMFFQLASHLNSHLHGLQDDIRDTGKSLRTFISRHRQILELVDAINKSYSPIIFIQCVLTAITVCTVSVQLMDSEKARLLGNVGFLAGVLLQWYIYCHGGEYIRTGVRFSF